MTLTSDDRLEAERVLAAIQLDAASCAQRTDIDPLTLTSVAAFLAVRTSTVEVEVDFEELLARCIRRLPENLLPGLWGGAPGAGWLLQYSAEQLGVSDDLIGSIDAFVAMVLEQGAYQEFDLIRGLTGGALYLLARPPTDQNRKSLRKALDALHAQAQFTPDGPVWLLKDETPALNLGVGHGVSGVIMALSGAVLADRATARDRELLEKASSALAAARNPTGRYRFPHRSSGEGRLAWCRCDLGVACALTRAGRALDRADLTAMALDTALAMVALPELETNVRDASLCHGSAGAALLFRDLALETGDGMLEGAAERWFRHTLTWYDPQAVLHGFGLADRGVFSPDSTVLSGNVGVGLLLQSFLVGERAPWERLLGLIPTTARNA